MLEVFYRLNEHVTRGLGDARSHRPLARLTRVTSQVSLSLVQSQGGVGDWV